MGWNLLRKKLSSTCEERMPIYVNPGPFFLCQGINQFCLADHHIFGSPTRSILSTSSLFFCEPGLLGLHREQGRRLRVTVFTWFRLSPNLVCPVVQCCLVH